MAVSNYPYFTLHKKTQIFFAVAVLTALGLASAYFYSEKIKRDNLATRRFVADYQEAVASHNRGDYDAAVAKFKQALMEAPNKTAEAELKRKIARSLLRGPESNQAEAIRLYKEIIDDPLVPKHLRAFALNDMAFAFDLRGFVGDQTFLEKAVFNEEPYASYLQESNTGIYGAVRRIYEQSDALYPTAFAKLEIAFKYAVTMNMGTREAGLSAEQTATLVRKYIDEATPLMGAFPYEGSLLAYMHLIRGVALGTIEQADKNNANSDESEAAYKSAILTVSTASPEDVHAQTILMLARLWYAANLGYRFGAARTGDIQMLIGPIIEAKSINTQPATYLRSHIRWVGIWTSGGALRKGLFEIAGILPEFRSLLIELGWRIT